MHCTKCNYSETSVVDSRPYPTYIRRKRKCDKCGHRFGTYEHAGESRNIPPKKVEEIKEAGQMNELKAWRMKLSLKMDKTITQEKAAEMLGYSASYYIQLEQSKKPILSHIKKNMKITLDGVIK